MFFRDSPSALKHFFFGPWYPQQYRLEGPGKQDGVREHIMTAHQYTHCHMLKKNTKVQYELSFQFCRRSFFMFYTNMYSIGIFYNPVSFCFFFRAMSLYQKARQSPGNETYFYQLREICFMCRMLNCVRIELESKIDS